MPITDAMRRARDLWLRAWPLWSVRMSAIGAILTALAAAAPDTLLQIWNALPDEVLAMVPASIGRVVPTLLFMATIAVRLIPQKPAAERQSLWKSLSGKVKPKAAGGLAAAVVLMISSVLVVEGGYVNDPSDPGGETNKGITKAVAVANGYTGPMRSLPDSVVHSIYYGQYIVAPGYAPLIAIDAPVTQELFDTTVNMGPGRPGRWFQLAINSGCGTKLTVDGRVGLATIAAYKACQGRVGAAALCVATLDRLDAQQRTEYDRLVMRNANLRKFHRGWIRLRIGNVDRARCRAAAV
jgi:lysozyme family protein